ncbi:signal peptide peptidase SppA [Calycomorphotria hydatis]|nr:signal peptide peptidase SppA [Calycomorphotria hydatis]
MSWDTPANTPAKKKKKRGGWMGRVLFFLLVFSILVNIAFYAQYQQYFHVGEGPQESFARGDEYASKKIAIIEVSGTIMPPLTEQTIASIKKAKDDDAVEGVILVVDSPGGLVADSHEIYHQLTKLREKKPIYVSMKRLAASGGYYIAMGAGPEGKIFAEPTTWTGSIGVILPRYNMKELGEKIGVSSEPLKTGPLKDALNPFKDLDPQEIEVWETIIDESFQQFVSIIADNREPLDVAAVKEAATGQVYTANQALDIKLIDEIGFEEDVFNAMKDKLKLKKVRGVTYSHAFDWATLLQSKAESPSSAAFQAILESSVPRAYYMMSSLPGIQK